MAQDKRQVDAITARDVDFAQWYTDVCKKAELIDYTSVKGMFIYRPYGYALWENIQAELESAVKALLDHIHDNLYAMALKNREDNTFDIQTPEEAKAIVEGKGGFLRSKWCGSLECELAMKERAGVSSRCMPLVQSGTEGTCPVCGRKCTTDIYWGVAY